MRTNKILGSKLEGDYLEMFEEIRGEIESSYPIKTKVFDADVIKYLIDFERRAMHALRCRQ